LSLILGILLTLF